MFKGPNNYGLVLHQEAYVPLYEEIIQLYKASYGTGNTKGQIYFIAIFQKVPFQKPHLFF